MAWLHSGKAPLAQVLSKGRDATAWQITLQHHWYNQCWHQAGTWADATLKTDTELRVLVLGPLIESDFRGGVEGWKLGSTCLFSVNFMIVVPREEKTMKDMRSIGLKQKNKPDPRLIHITSADFHFIRSEWEIMHEHVYVYIYVINFKIPSKKALPYELLSQAFHKRVNLCPMISDTSRSVYKT